MILNIYQLSICHYIYYTYTHYYLSTYTLDIRKNKICISCSKTTPVFAYIIMIIIIIIIHVTQFVVIVSTKNRNIINHNTFLYHRFPWKMYYCIIYLLYCLELFNKCHPNSHRNSIHSSACSIIIGNKK